MNRGILTEILEYGKTGERIALGRYLESDGGEGSRHAPVQRRRPFGGDDVA